MGKRITKKKETKNEHKNTTLSEQFHIHIKHVERGTINALNTHIYDRSLS